MKPELVTIDTNVLPADAVVRAAELHGFEVRFITTTEREVKGTSFTQGLRLLDRIPEIGVWGEMEWGSGTWADQGDADCLETAIGIIARGSFPPVGQRDVLTVAQRRQLRDAIIICTHRRSGLGIFVTNDQRAFIKQGRREQFHKLLNIQILTPREFVDRYGEHDGPPA